ncbi:MAG TPA: Hsp70 family protein [Pilimelia sp.]|nr:Hsp70 family protein [Pilimelia sp.]
MAASGMTTGGHALGVDFGTSHTVAVVRWPDGRARPLLMDGSPLLPSAVYAEPGGSLVVGRDAVHSARLDPARFDPNPKRRINEGVVLLGDREVRVVELAAAILGRIHEEWRRTVGSVVPNVTLTCPAVWGATRRQVLADAAARVGFGRVRLVAEPVAAATYFAQVLGRDVPIGSVVVVHDFGAGTFDASVVARKASGFEVLAVDGRDDLGGLDVDASLINHLRRAYVERDPAAWARLDTPVTVDDRRAKRQLWDDVRVAKERLSRSQRADLVIPLLNLEVHLTREELEEQARPLLEQTIRVTQGVMRWAQLAEGSIAGVFLVGGSSRIPLLATMMHRALGEAPVVIEQPELVVAEGSVLAGTTLLASAPAAPGPTSLISVSGAGSRELPASGVPVSPGPSAGYLPGPGGAVAPAVVVSPTSPAAPLPNPATPVPSSSAASGLAGGAAGPGVAGAGAVAGGSPVRPVSPATARSVGRVIVPGAQPPGPPRPAGAAPVAPTRPLPRMSGPASPAGPPAPASPAPRQPPPAKPPPTPPVAPPPTVRPTPSVRPAQVVRAAPPGPPLAPYPPSYPPAPESYYPRRPSALRRFIVGLLITLFLLAVPIIAGYIAYQLAEGRSPFPF